MKPATLLFVLLAASACGKPAQMAGLGTSAAAAEPPIVIGAPPNVSGPVMTGVTIQAFSSFKVNVADNSIACPAGTAVVGGGCLCDNGPGDAVAGRVRRFWISGNTFYCQCVDNNGTTAQANCLSAVMQ